MRNSKRRILPLLLLASGPLIIVQACGGNVENCPETDVRIDAGKFTVGTKFRVEVSDAQGGPVDGATVEIGFWKVHCNGDQSQHFVKEGTTGAEGVFSTELHTVYETFSFSNTEGVLWVQVAVLKDGWTETMSRIHTYYQLLSLPKAGSDPNDKERRLVDVYQLVYDGS